MTPRTATVRRDHDQTPRPARGRDLAPSEERSSAWALGVPAALVEAIAERVADLLADRLAAPAVAEPWIDVRQAAEHIGAPTSRVYDLVSAGALRPGRDGRRIAFRRSELDAYMDCEATS